MERRLWSQVVAVASGLAANVVAVWSQSRLSDSASNPVAGLLSCEFAGAPRGIRTPNRQIRSLVTVGPCLNHLAGHSEYGAVDASDTRAAGLLCPGSG